MCYLLIVLYLMPTAIHTHILLPCACSVKFTVNILTYNDLDWERPGDFKRPFETSNGRGTPNGWETWKGSWTWNHRET